VYPGILGGTNWWSPTFDAQLELLFVPTLDQGSFFFASPNESLEAYDKLFAGYTNYQEDLITAVKALELMTGRVRWQYTRPGRKDRNQMGGLLSTAGRLIFGGDNETFFALNAETGAQLWHFEVGGWVAAAPMSYEVAGRQYIAIAAGTNIVAFALPSPDVKSSAVPR
jgi:alcohol dehydrogenase (cytochrome c)